MRPFAPFIIFVAIGCSTAPSPARSGGLRATWFCPARTMQRLPKPPPPPSAQAKLPDAQFVGPDDEPLTVRQVGLVLETLLVQAKFRRRTYLGFGCSGFAVVTDLERINLDGTPKEGSERFAPIGDTDTFDIPQVYRRLSYAPSGLYRQMVFVVSDREEVERLPTSIDLAAEVATGQTNLPYGYDEVPFDPERSVRVLYYEFEKGTKDGQVRLLDEGKGFAGPIYAGAPTLRRIREEPTE